MKALIERWIIEPDENEDGLLRIFINGSEETDFPLPVETHNVRKEDVAVGEQQDFSMFLDSAEIYGIYSDENDYMENRQYQFAPECVIPTGLFTVTDNPDYVPSATALINGRVTAVYPDNPEDIGFDRDDLLIQIKVLGVYFDAVIHKEHYEDNRIESGNIISGTFWVQGYPSNIDY